MGVSPSDVGVCPSRPYLGKVERCPTEPGPGWPGLGGDGEPGGECGKVNRAVFGGSWRILCEESLFQPRLGKLLGRGKVTGPLSGGRPGVMPGVAQANGP